MFIWVITWFVIVILVTSLNKTLFTTLNCPFPITITLIHMISCAVYSSIMRMVLPDFYRYRPLKKTEIKSLIAVSVIFIVNIVLSNTSLKYNSLALDQMFRCTMPVFTCILEFLIHGTKRSVGVYCSLIPVIFGTMLVCLGDVHGSVFGILLLVVSCTISSLKGIITRVLLSGNEPLSTFQLLNINALLSIAELLPFSVIKDSAFYNSWIFSAPWTSILILIIHGVLAFFLNVANFNAVKEGGPLMMNVVGNVKQVVMIFISLFLFGNKIKPIGLVGSAICIMGSMWYTRENMKSNKEMKVMEEKQQLIAKDTSKLVEKEDV